MLDDVGEHSDRPGPEIVGYALGELERRIPTDDESACDPEAPDLLGHAKDRSRGEHDSLGEALMNEGQGHAVVRVIARS